MIVRRVGFILVLAALAAAPAMADLVTNGSFENAPTISMTSYPSGGGFVSLGTNSTAITGWIVIGGTTTRAVDYIGNRWLAADGTRSVDLDGYNGGGTSRVVNGGVEQSINTLAGHAYLVTFDMSGNPEGDLNIAKTMNVIAQGASTQVFPFTFPAHGSTLTNMNWQAKQFTFVADGPTLLEFVSTTPGTGYGPVLDKVNVSAVPVPAAVLLGMLGLSVAGVKLRRFV
jgi:choice-of-anchor C domain-containing protein